MLSWLWRQVEERRHAPTPASADEANDDPSPERVFYDAAARLLDVQISTDDVLDTRNTGIFSVGSTVLPLTFGLLNLGDTDIPRWAIRSLAVALACYFLLLVSSWRASLFRALEFRPHLPTLWENSELHPGFALRGWVASEYLASTEENKKSLVRKARWVGIASSFLYAEGFCLSLAALLTLL